MKIILTSFLCLVFYFSFSQTSQLTDFYEKYVEPNGLVNYKLIDQNELRIILDELESSIQLADQNDETEANLINYYNLQVIAAALRNYPLKSVMQVANFFDKKSFKFKGEEISLNELEKSIIFRDYPDPRLHFALNCGAMGCPPLLNKPYLGSTLEEQLEFVTTRFMNDPQYTKIDEGSDRVGVSEIFRWYVDDFKNSGGVKSFLSKYTNKDLSNADIYYYPYDWDLNTSAVEFNPEDDIRPYRVSSLYTKGKVEVKLWNGIWSEKFTSADGTAELQSSYMSNFLQLLIGTNKNINYGGDLIFKSNVQNELASRGVFAPLKLKKESKDLVVNGSPVLSYDDTPVKTHYDYGVSHIGPKIKLPITRKIPSLILQQTFYFPIEKHVDGSYVSFTQFFYDKLIGTNQQLFLEASTWFKYAPEVSPSFYFKAFYSYFPSNKFTIYGTAVIPAEVGLGSKYFITPKLEIEVLATKYIPVWQYKDRNAFTVNLGLRYNN